MTISLIQGRLNFSANESLMSHNFLHFIREGVVPVLDLLPENYHINVDLKSMYGQRHRGELKIFDETNNIALFFCDFSRDPKSLLSVLLKDAQVDLSLKLLCDEIDNENTILDGL